MSFEADADLASERIDSDAPVAVKASSLLFGSDAAAEAEVLEFIPLRLNGRTYMKTRSTETLLRRIGGGVIIHRLLNTFYAKMFQDGHLDQFVRTHDDPHAARLANWIIEKMGGEGDVWTQERVERSKCPVAVHLPGRGEHVVHDRSSAHVAAWFSPKRPEHRLGDHFKLHDTRVWMRLMFWSCRELGLFEDKIFESWFMRFIAHFVRVYEGTAPYFARESARWSLDPANIKAYEANGNKMPTEIMGLNSDGIPIRDAISQLPPREVNDDWPYNTTTTE